MAEPDRPLTSTSVQLLHNPAWASFDWLQHGFSTRQGGISTAYSHPSDREATDQLTTDLNLGWTKEDSPANVEENRRRLIAAVSQHQQPLPQLITVRQIHSDRTLILPDSTLQIPATPAPAAPSPTAPGLSAPGQPVCEGDGLITDTPGLLLGIQTADCVPILLADTRLRVVAAFHAGWRGTVARIVERGAQSLTDRFGSHPHDLSAAIGPAIGPCCYTVGEEVHTRFHAAFDYAEALFHPEPGSLTLKLDLWQANRRQLLAAGLAPESITTLTHCTACSRTDQARQFFSYRAEAGLTGRMMSVIGIAADPASR